VSTSDLYEAGDFATFYQRYRVIHAARSVRIAHAVATASAAALLGYAFATRKPIFALAAPVVDFAIAQASHRRDGQVTQPWRRPAWHLRAELRLFRETVRSELTRR
jgi:hypothetical protein